MKDALEQHILTHKAELDVFDPGDRIWEAIDQELQEERTVPLRARFGWAWKIAAAVLVLVVLALGIRQWMPVQDQLSQAGPIESRSHYSPELIEVEDYYNTVIDDKVNLVRQFQQEGVVTDEDLFTSLEELRTMYQDLQGELLQGANQELVVNAMVQNLTMQMEILNQQLSILEQIKSMQDEQPTSL